MIAKNIDLKPYNTFGISSIAEEFSSFSNEDELRSLIANNSKKLTVLGGGSNVLFTKNIEGLVLRNEIKGFEITAISDDVAHVKVGAGEVWHSFVLKCIENNLGGIENLSLIPGSVGASPMQNIGAYGVEIKDVFVELTALHIDSGQVKTFSKEECEFGYRESVFKRKLKGQYIITSVTYALSRKNHTLKTSYGIINDELSAMGISEPTIKDISDAVIRIRSSKLPDPNKIGNAGSFFKNPIVELNILKKIEANFENVPNYPAKDGHVKLAAGWLIEKSGWKGKTMENYGVHKNQALVLVNYGGCTGNQILSLSEEIIRDVFEKFGVRLEREVNIL